MNNKIKVLIIEPGKKPYQAEINSDLKSLQKIVGGTIQAIYPYENDPVAIICHDEGKLIGLPCNRLLIIDGVICDIIVGTFIITDLTEDNFGSLSEELIRKYIRIFDVIY